MDNGQLLKKLALTDAEANYSKERTAQVAVQIINADPSTGGGARSINNPLLIPTGIDAFRVRVSNTAGGATSAVAGTLYFKPGTQISPGSVDYETLGDSDVRIFNFRQAGCLFWWPAQVGVTITITFYTGIGAYLGSLGVRLLNNAVSITSGSAADAGGLGAAFNVASIAVAGTTTLIGTDTTRKSVTFQVNGGDIWIADSAPAVGTRGIKITDGSSFIWGNTAALVAINSAGAPVVTGIVEH